MKDIKMTIRGKEVLINNPIIKNFIWWPLAFIGMCGIFLFFILLPILLTIHFVLCILTGGKIKIMRFEQ